ncbi:hypothetical protein RclHR1_01820005 [Rhizophagus clarus]|uniref:Uncharacterized protein n=1 Tax=Rhizophagus clarus TaxID=94130 RepID=A0A2Z6RET2_9GLOM|nr:hypothetical protein RclHR1_01820005 [Rhizophagus clarus]GES92419.1 hypothetical protein GLOIN_2v1829585 [Rhizophagus clarus]
MFKVDDLYFSKTEGKNDKRTLKHHLETLFEHYQSIRWLFFWLFYTLYKDKEPRIAEARYFSEFSEFTESYSDRWWFANELWDYNYVEDVQNYDKKLYKAIIEYESI